MYKQETKLEETNPTMVTGIKMTYTWGDEEPVVECSKEDAWQVMCELAGKEMYNASCEGAECTVKLYPDEETPEIILQYSDGEECKYQFGTYED